MGLTFQHSDEKYSVFASIKRDEEGSWSKMKLAEEENVSCKTRFRAVSNMDAGLRHVHQRKKN